MNVIVGRGLERILQRKQGDAGTFGLQGNATDRQILAEGAETD